MCRVVIHVFSSIVIVHSFFLSLVYAQNGPINQPSAERWSEALRRPLELIDEEARKLSDGYKPKVEHPRIIQLVKDNTEFFNRPIDFGPIPAKTTYSKPGSGPKAGVSLKSSKKLKDGNVEILGTLQNDVRPYNHFWTKAEREQIERLKKQLEALDRNPQKRQEERNRIQTQISQATHAADTNAWTLFNNATVIKVVAVVKKEQAATVDIDRIVSTQRATMVGLVTDITLRERKIDPRLETTIDSITIEVTEIRE